MNGMMLSEEELLLRNAVRDFADQELSVRAADYDESAEFPWDNLDTMKKLGLFGLTIDEEYGGSGGTWRQLALVVEELARGCASTSLIYIAHLSLTTQFIHQFGSKAQKQKFIPPLATFEKIGAFALTEPGAGSDAGALQTRLAKSDGHYVVSGQKTFITNAPQAEIFVVLATSDRSLGTRGINSLIVESGGTGMTVNPLTGKMGMRASSIAEVVLEDYAVPFENRMGGEEEGFRQTMQLLNSSRITIAAQCVGIAQAAYEAAVSYAKQRAAFGKHLADLQAIQFMIADMATNIDAARLLVLRAATLKDEGHAFGKEASMAKLFASRVAVEVSDKALQIHGGAGYFAPAPVERHYREAKVTEIYEGTSEVQRLIIARNVLESKIA